ncbi:MAG: tRNA 2-selenouridine(34) synthase MnmH [Proteobacteria bacterium]|nr:tRNA 2-selenouridine(34) synthase MnmH [Burkholderiales bacterium]
MNDPLISTLDALADPDRYDAVIDVRSPSEFNEDHLPHALSCPVLDDEERARVGTLHKQHSAFEARRVGGALAARNIARHVETVFADHPREWSPLIYCWRGGQRSRSFTHVLREIGWRAEQLEGGYRAYRRRVIDDLALLPAEFSFRVICGRTGCGKSRLLRELSTLGAQVLDLEALAAHRGSVLGDLPDAQQPPQKLFESRVWNALRRFDRAQPVFIEAESKRIGVVHVPDALIARMRAAPTLRLEASVATRTRLLIDEYRHLIDDTPRLLARIECLRALHSTATIAHWRALIDARDWDTFVATLLAQHYDSAYDRSMFRNYAGHVDAPVVELAGIEASAVRAAARAMLDVSSTLALAA